MFKGKVGGSQSNEDDLIAEIFDRIGEGDKRFIEFGCGDGRQNNTIALLKRGWWGTWYEPHKKRCLSAKERWAGYPVNIVRRLITPKKVNLVVLDPLDFLSIDVDGQDLEIWAAIKAKPRVVCIEVHPYARMMAIAMGLAIAKGYKIAALSESEVNAFFIRDDQ